MLHRRAGPEADLGVDLVEGLGSCGRSVPEGAAGQRMDWVEEGSHGIESP